ncbi:MAG: amidohydrolase family protein, partial [Eggerthellaceae bacterium]|nr:amidohydrolase family protein [Eggerthellaceae bacterium]
YGSDRIMFGSDYPLFNPAEEINTFLHESISKEVFEKITWRNMERYANVRIS